MSGEKLQLDLSPLEGAYLESNKREFELAKHISLVLIKSLALLLLREKGSCHFDLLKEILDYQEHYFRRIKSVSLSIPCISGLYTIFEIDKNSVRFNNLATPQYASSGGGDTRFM